MSHSNTTSNQLFEAKRQLEFGDTEAAKQILETLQTQAPKHPDVLLGLSQVFVLEQRWAMAIDALYGAKQTLGFAPDIELSLLQLEFQYGSRDSAVDIINAFIRSPYAGHHKLLTAYLNACQQLRWQQGVEQLIKNAPFKNLQDFQSILMMLKQMSHSPGTAITLLQHAVHRYPKSVSTWRQLAQAHAQNFNYSQAIEAFNEVVSLNGYSETIATAFADLYLLAHDLTKAQVWVDKALAMNPKLPSAHEVKLRIAHFRGEQNQQSAKQLLRLAPQNGYAWRALVETASDNELTDITFRLTEAIKVTADTFHAKLMQYTLGRALSRLKNYDRAFSAFEAANAVQQAQLRQRNQIYCSATTQTQFERLKCLRLPTSESAPELQPIFIVGLPRSGTTLMDKILQQVPDSKSLGESMQLEKLVCQHCFDLNREVIPEQLSQEQTHEIRQGYLRKAGAAAVIIDKMPHNFRFVNLILAAFPNAKIVQMRRDLMANGWSIYTQPFTDSHNYSVDLVAIGDFYRQSHQLMDCWADRYKNSVTDVSYEALVCDPDNTLRQLFAFCGLEWHKEYLDFHLHATPSFTFSENQVRQPLNTKSLEAWFPFAPHLTALKDS